MVADNKKSSLIGCCSYGGKTRARPKGTLRSAKNCDREHVKSFAVENEKSPIKSDFCSCGGKTRTCDLQVMSLASYQLLHSAILGCQNQCKPNAESLLFAEVKPDFAGLFSKSAAKVRLFPEICKFFCIFFRFAYNLC